MLLEAANEGLMNSTLLSTILGVLKNPNNSILLSPFIVSVILSVGTTAGEGVHTRTREFLEPKLPVKLSVKSNKIQLTHHTHHLI